MRIGTFVGEVGGQGGTLEAVIGQIRRAEADGFSSAWLAQIFGLDAITTVALAGAQVPRIELGTAVVPTYPRHPVALAGQALTAAAATGNRFVLGIGLSHQIVIEGMYGLSFAKPARHMREYLGALVPLLSQEAVEFRGETLTAVGTIKVPGAEPVPVLLAALGPVMLRLAGTMADGTVTWMTGPATVASHVVPTITAAATAAGRTAPRVVVGLPVCVTTDAGATRERAAKTFALYGGLPSYRAMLDREGAAGPADVAIVGDEDAVAKQLEDLAAGGATDYLASPFGSREERERTYAVLAELARRSS